jgi:hypothetical protein
VMRTAVSPSTNHNGTDIFSTRVGTSGKPRSPLILYIGNHRFKGTRNQGRE